MFIVPVHELGHTLGLVLQGATVTGWEIGPMQGTTYTNAHPTTLTLLMGPLAVTLMYLILTRITRFGYVCAIVSLAYIPHEFGIDAFFLELLATCLLYGIGFALIALQVIA